MATESMMRDVYRRMTWRNNFEHEVDEYCPDPTHEPIDWSLAMIYYREGYIPRDAARMYCERCHSGVNS